MLALIRHARWPLSPQTDFQTHRRLLHSLLDRWTGSCRAHVQLIEAAVAAADERAGAAEEAVESGNLSAAMRCELEGARHLARAACIVLVSVQDLGV